MRQVLVVGDDEEPSVKETARLNQSLDRVQVEVVGRLVEQ